MNCSPKTMLKIAIGLAAVLAFAYFALPEAQAASLLAKAPLLLALLCPLAMLLMAFTMNRTSGPSKDRSVRPREVAGSQTTEARDVNLIEHPNRT